MDCESQLCQSAGVLGVDSTERGVLSSEMTVTSGCGSSACPWVLEAQPGQLFNITLLDFWSRSDFVDIPDISGPYCHRYASITEEGYTTKDVTSCGKDYQRASHIYESHSNRITVTMYEPKTNDVPMHFLVNYQGKIYRQWS